MIGNILRRGVYNEEKDEGIAIILIDACPYYPKRKIASTSCKECKYYVGKKLLNKKRFLVTCMKEVGFDDR